MIKDSGAKVKLVNPESRKAFYADIQEERERRVPQIMEDLNISEDQAQDPFDTYESMGRWHNQPIDVVPIEKEKTKPALPEGMESTRP